MTKSAFFIPLVVFLLFPSCAARINGSLQGDGQADLAIYASLEPRMTALLQALASVSGTAKPGANLLDGAAITASMAAAPGIASVSLKNSAPAAIEGPVKIARVGDFLASGAGKRSFIGFEQNPASGEGRCTVSLSLDSGPEILSLFSPDIGIYLSALMAPLATGEAMTRAAYLALVGTVYGKGIADEISGAAVQVIIDFPAPVQKAEGGTFSGRRAEFSIPLLDILVLETPLNYEVTWRRQ